MREYDAAQAAAELAAAPIHSLSDLQAYKSIHQKDSPLNVLSPMDRRLFEDSLTYNDSGVTSFRYDVLKSLTPTQAYKILATIGMQGFTSNLQLQIQSESDRKIMSVKPSPAALPGYYCQSQGTCRTANDRACSDGC